MINLRMSKPMERCIDFVILWVDGNDPAWQMEKQKYEQQAREEANDPAFDIWANNPMRYRDWDNLQYWFRGVEEFAPWVRKVHFVTWGHLPPWLNVEHPKLHIVNHRDFIPAQYLPTFQANTIEDNLHRIDGLSEQFVYFNDDTFIIRKMVEVDFFKNGLPCDCAILNMPVMDRNGTPFANTSAEIINDHFEKNKVIRESLSKWFNLKYGSQILKTVALMPWRRFGTLYQPHLPTSLLKSTFEKLWEVEGDALDKTCRERFRRKGQLSQYIFVDWQRATGRFYPRSPRVGKSFFLGKGTSFVDIEQMDEAVAYIRKQRGKMVCLNDGDMTDEEFQERKTAIRDAFQSILPEKSSFEK